MAHDLIEELIEESYLLSLSEPEIRLYLTHFIESCDTVVNERLNGSNDLRIIGIKVALLRARFFVHARSVPAMPRKIRGDATSDETGALIGHVLETKRAIKKLLDSIDPVLVEAVERAMKSRKSHSVTVGQRKSGSGRPPTIVYRIGYIGLYLLVAGMLLTYLAY